MHMRLAGLTSFRWARSCTHVWRPDKRPPPQVSLQEAAEFALTHAEGLLDSAAAALLAAAAACRAAAAARGEADSLACAGMRPIPLFIRVRSLGHATADVCRRAKRPSRSRWLFVFADANSVACTPPSCWNDLR